MVFRVGDSPASAVVQQVSDGSLHIALEAEDEREALAELRFLLAVDHDHTGFLERVRDDPLLGDVVSAGRGMRPSRTSVAQALVHAFAGQLITGREAWLIERRITAALGTRHAGLVLPLTAEELRRVPAAAFVRFGLAPQRARALARSVRVLNLERLRHEPLGTAAARLLREPMIGPWTLGLVALRGLGSYRYGIAGDLNLMRLCTNLLGRRATVADTQALLDGYGEWAGIASLHLMRHPLAHRRTFAA